MRTGVVTKKLGMTTVYNKDGVVIPVTILQVRDCEVVASKVVSKEGYNSIQVGAVNAKIKNVSKPLKGHYALNKVAPKMKLKEFRVAEENLIPAGTRIFAEHFIEGQFVDVSARSIGKGFAGVMKRWNFGGMRASHGVSITHRAHGSTGQRQDPGRVAKGKKMAGHLGDKNITVQNLQVVMIDSEDQLIIVKGAVPGSKNGYVYVTDAIKRSIPANAPTPTFMIKEEIQHSPEIQEEVINAEGASSES